MNGHLAFAQNLVQQIRLNQPGNADILICPPFPYLLPVKEALAGSDILLGAQNCHGRKQGAYTGEVAASMLKDCGCEYVILGHSERRHGLGETNDQIKEKAERAIEAGLRPIICIGETEQERDRGDEKNIIKNQLINSLPESSFLVLAYEPVWAIGTGKTANETQIADMHSYIHELLKEMKRENMLILYGGSVKPDNAHAILSLPHVGGALVGGASLKAEDFLKIHAAAR